MPKFLPIRGRLRVFTNGESAPQMKVWTRGPAWDDLRRWNNRDFDSDFKQAPSACPQSREHQRSTGASNGTSGRRSGAQVLFAQLVTSPPLGRLCWALKPRAMAPSWPPLLPARFGDPVHLSAAPLPRRSCRGWAVAAWRPGSRNAGRKTFALGWVDGVQSGQFQHGVVLKQFTILGAP